MSVDRHIKGGFQPPTEEEIFRPERLKSEIELGMLQMQILWILNRKPRHGYEIMKELSVLKGTKITQGTLYPTLQKLEGSGLVERDEEARRIVYHTTEKGKKVMNQTCSEFTRTFFGIFHDFVCNKCVSRDIAKR